MAKELKTVIDSRCVMTEFVLPNDSNGLGHMMGGRLMHLMDKCAAISAHRHANRICVTVSVDTVSFDAPIHVGEIVILESWVNRAFRTSMEIELSVVAENALTRARRTCNYAYFTFVAIDKDGRPTPVPAIYPQTAVEQSRYATAAERRRQRLDQLAERTK